MLYDQMAKQAQSTEADLLSFQEVDSTWMNELVVHLKNQYPHYHLSYQDMHGVAVFINIR